MEQQELYLRQDQKDYQRTELVNIVRSTTIASCDTTLEFHVHPLPLNAKIATIISVIHIPINHMR